MGKPPPSRHVLPRGGGSDYDQEEATTLDPFVIHEDELVVVPKVTTSTDAIRDDLRADPDVQDALRWLDPPSNAGPPVAVIVPVAAPPPDREGYAPPVRHPSSPPYAQVYTPVPQPYPGAGPYPTPVPTYVPHSGAYYLPTPMPTAVPPAPSPARSPILWILLTALVTGGGIALGWWLFAGRHLWNSAQRPAAARAPAVAPQPSPQAQTPPPAPHAPPPVAPTPPPAAPAEPVTAEVTAMAQRDSVAIAAPLSGQVSKVFLSASRKVAKGDKLLEIRSESGGGSKAKKLAARVAELEKLAKDDPVYEEFLADARKAQKAVRARVETVVVAATDAGVASLAVKDGDAVSSGKPVAHISRGGDWTISATASSEVQRSWACSVGLPDGKKAACTIDKVVATPAGSDITATVVAKDAPWLQDMAQKPTLTLGPQ